MAERFDYSNYGFLLLVRDFPFRQLALGEKKFGWMALWYLNPEVVRIVLEHCLCDLGRGITLVEGPRSWRGRAVPPSNYTLEFG